ncbi:hypothetical protein [Microbacterium sp. G2-8]|nr:hypothetical protein [Microbacterium sp. G2-8]
MPAGTKTFALIVGLVTLGMTALAAWAAVRSIVFFLWLIAFLTARGGAM